MKNQAAFLVLVFIIAVMIAFIVSRAPMPVHSVLIVKDGEWFEPSAEYRAATRTRKPVVTHRDGDWAEIKLDSGELSFEPDRDHLYGEAKDQR